MSSINPTTDVRPPASDLSMTRLLLIGAAVWFVAALAIGATGRMSDLGPYAPPTVIGILSASLITLFLTWPRFRQWALHLSPRALILIHVVRAPIGLVFLLLAERGMLAEGFAFQAGWGDIIAGVSALLFIGLRDLHSSKLMRLALIAWNTFGLLDILNAPRQATTELLNDPSSMNPLLSVPGSAIPLWVVPLVITSHLLIYVMMARCPRRAATQNANN